MSRTMDWLIDQMNLETPFPSMAKQEALFPGGRSATTFVLEPLTSVLLLLERTRMGPQRKLNLSKIPDLPKELREELVSAEAKILQCPELQAIANLDAATDRWLRKNGLPSIFKWGATLLSTQLVPAAEAMLLEYRVNRRPLVDTYVARYVDLVEAAQTKLGPTLSAAIQWPPTDTVRDQFTLAWRWLRFEIPDDLPQDVRARAERAALEDYARQQRTVQAALRLGFERLVDRLVERMTPSPTGKKKIIRDTVIDSMKEFLDAFPKRYIASDEELLRLVEKAEALLQGVSPEDVRGNSDLQGYLAREFTRIDLALEPLVSEVKQSARKITFEDDTEDESPVP